MFLQILMKQTKLGAIVWFLGVLPLPLKSQSLPASSVSEIKECYRVLGLAEWRKDDKTLRKILAPKYFVVSKIDPHYDFWKNFKWTDQGMERFLDQHHFVRFPPSGDDVIVTDKRYSSYVMHYVEANVLYVDNSMRFDRWSKRSGKWQLLSSDIRASKGYCPTRVQWKRRQKSF
jgi:hypothetical protein